MSTEPNDRALGMRTSWLLRHGAFASGLVMDEAGWVSVDAAVTQLGVTRAAGLTLFRSPNGVLLARSVPPDCLRAPPGP